MTELLLIGIGTGNPGHLTDQARGALREADLVLIPRKGPDKADLADLRSAICAQVLGAESAKVVEFDLPLRDRDNPDYRAGVEAWHDAIARSWAAGIAAHARSPEARVALLVWGDPSLYDSTLRIAARLGLVVRVVPGITAIQALCAAHAITLNEIGAPFLVTTGRRLRDQGWPDCADTLVVMLDGDCAFESLDPAGVTIWWGAYLGMAEEILESGPLADAGPRIRPARMQARARHGWIMDVYLLRRAARG